MRIADAASRARRRVDFVSASSVGGVPRIVDPRSPSVTTFAEEGDVSRSNEDLFRRHISAFMQGEAAAAAAAAAAVGGSRPTGVDGSALEPVGDLAEPDLITGHKDSNYLRFGDCISLFSKKEEGFLAASGFVSYFFVVGISLLVQVCVTVFGDMSLGGGGRRRCPPLRCLASPHSCSGLCASMEKLRGTILSHDDGMSLSLFRILEDSVSLAGGTRQSPPPGFRGLGCWILHVVFFGVENLRSAGLGLWALLLPVVRAYLQRSLFSGV